MSFRVHLLIPDEAGPIHSGPGGTPLPIGRVGRWRIACDPTLNLSTRDRGTGESYLICCAKCQALLDGELKHLAVPNPRQVEPPDVGDPGEA